MTISNWQNAVQAETDAHVLIMHIRDMARMNLSQLSQDVVENMRCELLRLQIRIDEQQKNWIGC